MTKVRLIILMGMKVKAKRYSNVNTTAFPLQPAARRIQAVLKNIFVVSHIKKYGFNLMKDPGTDLTAETPAKMTSEGNSLHTLLTNLHPIS